MSVDKVEDILQTRCSTDGKLRAGMATYQRQHGRQNRRPIGICHAQFYSSLLDFTKDDRALLFEWVLLHTIRVHAGDSCLTELEASIQCYYHIHIYYAYHLNTDAG